MNSLLTTDEFLEFIHHPLAYEQRLVNIIDRSGKQTQLISASDLYSTSEPYTIKVEGMEKYSPQIYEFGNTLAEQYGLINRPITCHAFLAKQDSPSFPVHTDPDHVFIYCCEGIKVMEICGIIHNISAGEHVHIRPYTEHRAINQHVSLILSFGIEYFLKDKIENTLLS
jgi:mannose-6-phosphate isomerase-like protein (cupin superfamily)